MCGKIVGSQTGWFGTDLNAHPVPSPVPRAGCSFQPRTHSWPWAPRGWGTPSSGQHGLSSACVKLLRWAEVLAAELVSMRMSRSYPEAMLIPCSPLPDMEHLRHRARSAWCWSWG